MELKGKNTWATTEFFGIDAVAVSSHIILKARFNEFTARALVEENSSTQCPVAYLQGTFG